MRRQDAASFLNQWKRRLGWEKGSRVVVLLEDRWEWEMLSEQFRERFIWYYEVLYMEVQKDLFPLENQLEQLQRLHVTALVGIGSFSLLQKVCLLRDGLVGEQIPLLLFSGKDRWQAFFRETLWIRGRDGRTKHWGYMKQHERDTLVLLAGKGSGRLLQGGRPENQSLSERSADELFDCFEEEIYCWKYVLKKLTAEENGSAGQTTDKQDIRDFLGNEGIWMDNIERDICEELSEPLRVVYGIPMEIGSYFALLHLYRLLPEGEQEKVCRMLGLKAGYGGWQLERLAHRYRKDELDGILLPGKDVLLLTQMAMEGIENYPEREQITWEQAELFYRRLCR